ncbi:MAG TPA: hypothetical protein VNE71_18275, partial [Myxococcota bacterium]|nr:hypothetical protein [Myxococcota bacterium]
MKERRLAEAEIAHAAGLAQAQVREVRRGRVDLGRRARLAELRAQRGEHVPALGQRRALEVVDAAAQELVPHVLELLDDRRVRRRAAIRRASEPVADARKERDRRLAGAGGAADRDVAGRRPRDEREL